MIWEKRKKLYIKRHKIYTIIAILLMVIFMKVKIFDESHETDLEDDINDFLNDNDVDVVNIKYSISNSIYSEEQIYCFSALIMYNEKSD